ncbi:hypothetical protein AB4Y63_17165 [Leifsonia sp. YAF41]
MGGIACLVHSRRVVCSEGTQWLAVSPALIFDARCSVGNTPKSIFRRARLDADHTRDRRDDEENTNADPAYSGINEVTRFAKLDNEHPSLADSFPHAASNLIEDMLALCQDVDTDREGEGASEEMHDCHYQF